MTCFELPKWLVKRIQVLCRNFLWGSPRAKGLPLIGWDVACLSKENGGLGIANLEMRNKSLLLRWRKGSAQTDSLWGSFMQLIRKNKPQQLFPKIWLMDGSFFWHQLIKLYPLFQWCTPWNIGDGRKISYWYDCFGTAPLRKMKDRLPRPPQLHISLNEALIGDSEVLSYNTGTVPDLYDQEDVLSWRWSGNGNYSASSVYKLVTTAGKLRWRFSSIWRAVAPSKVKIFCFLLLKDRILTRNMLRRRGMNCEHNCVLCEDNAVETAYHLFFQCENEKRVWARSDELLVTMDTIEDTWEASKLRYSSTVGQRKTWPVRFMAVLWFLWRQHNELIFQASRLPYWQAATRAEEDYKLWFKFCSFRSANVNGRPS